MRRSASLCEALHTCVMTAHAPHDNAPALLIIFIDTHLQHVVLGGDACSQPPVTSATHKRWSRDPAKQGVQVQAFPVHSK